MKRKSILSGVPTDKSGQLDLFDWMKKDKMIFFCKCSHLMLLLEPPPEVAAPVPEGFDMFVIWKVVKNLQRWLTLEEIFAHITVSCSVGQGSEMHITMIFSSSTYQKIHTSYLILYFHILMRIKSQHIKGILNSISWNFLKLKCVPSASFFATFQTLAGFENAGNGVFLLSFLSFQ